MIDNPDGALDLMAGAKEIAKGKQAIATNQDRIPESGKTVARLAEEREELQGKLEEDASEFKSKFYRDPVHDVIEVDHPLIQKLIDSREMQRLRGIRQLGNTSLVYPGAEHSRFEHALGAYHLARRMLAQISRNRQDVTYYDHLVVQAAALLHDIGHTAYSHLFEQVLEQFKYCDKKDRDHEQWTKRIIGENTQVGRILEGAGTVFRDDVRTVIDKSFYKRHLFSIVSSQFDIDRMDYMLRDSHMTGVLYGRIDFNWLLRNLSIGELSKKDYPDNDAYEPYVITINLKRGRSVLQGYLLGNLNLYRHVYLHKTVQAADAMVILMLKKAVELIKAGDGCDIHHPILNRIASNKPFELEQYLAFNDNVVLSWINQWANVGPDPTLKSLAISYLERQLYKVVDLSPLESNRTAAQEFWAGANKVLEPVPYGWRVCEPERRAYKTLDPDQIYYVTSDDDKVPKRLGEIDRTADGDPITNAIVSNLKYNPGYLAVAQKFRKTITEILDKAVKA